MAFLLPLVVNKLKSLTKRDAEAIEKAVYLAIDHDTNLVIAIRSEEIKTNKHCMDTIWETVQAFLGTVYVIQLQASYAKNKPLFDCNVVFQDLCGYDIFSEPGIDTICIQEKSDLLTFQYNQKTVLLEMSASKEIKEFVVQEHTGPIEPLAFQRVAVGGTFDHLHAGHRILLTMTAILAQSSMVVGVTDDCMLTKKAHKELIAPTSQRVEYVKNYMQAVKRGIDYYIVPITDPFGPTATDPTIDALVVSKETLKGGDLVNNERAMRGLPPLELRIIDVISSNNSSVQGQDMGLLKISSSWIREYIAKQRAG
ncbi:Uncharacterized protein C1F12.08 [Choanephora cucurbitarum]|uniref:Uncharacterized protein C1F12.08 n=1 Tax=Choanephora cucurbitarum TaxID=101091 RepID=A0A1C7N7P0_9FUNG|nr:Uncharacterized protein C1F12.08 [Choanephora cucurbitarum]